MARASRIEWAKRIAEWRKSGLTGAEFAQRIGVKEATLRHWKWQLARTRPLQQSRPATPSALGFVEISPDMEPSAEDPFEVELAGGVRLRVPQRFDVAALKHLLAVLEGR